MQDHTIIQEYVNNFRRHLAPQLRPGIALASRAHPAKGEGALVEFFFKPGGSNQDETTAVFESVNEALGTVTQHMVGGNVAGVRFGGTNISMEPDRILLIKGEDAMHEWDDAAALRDVLRIIAPQRSRL
jgi:hypothetical protein